MHETNDMMTRIDRQPPRVQPAPPRQMSRNQNFKGYSAQYRILSCGLAGIGDIVGASRTLSLANRTPIVTSSPVQKRRAAAGGWPISPTVAKVGTASPERPYMPGGPPRSSST